MLQIFLNWVVTSAVRSSKSGAVWKLYVDGWNLLIVGFTIEWPGLVCASMSVSLDLLVWTGWDLPEEESIFLIENYV